MSNIDFYEMLKRAVAEYFYPKWSYEDFVNEAIEDYMSENASLMMIKLNRHLQDTREYIKEQCSEYIDSAIQQWLDDVSETPLDCTDLPW